MKMLRDLLEGMEAEIVKGSPDVPAADIIYDSRKDCRESVFVCISGTKVDAHRFIPDVKREEARGQLTAAPASSKINYLLL